MSSSPPPRSSASPRADKATSPLAGYADYATSHPAAGRRDSAQPLTPPAPRTQYEGLRGSTSAGVRALSAPINHWRHRRVQIVSSGGIELLDDPVARELLSSAIPARLAYNLTDGSSRVVAIWFERAGNDIVMCTFPTAPKLRDLRSGDRVALTIDTDEPPNHILSIRGTCEVTTHRGVVGEYARRQSATSATPKPPRTSAHCRPTFPWHALRCIPSTWSCWISRCDFRARSRPLVWRHEARRSGGRRVTLAYRGRHAEDHSATCTVIRRTVPIQLLARNKSYVQA
jgi:hypothetical protein